MVQGRITQLFCLVFQRGGLVVDGGGAALLSRRAEPPHHRVTRGDHQRLGPLIAGEKSAGEVHHTITSDLVGSTNILTGPLCEQWWNMHR